MTAQEIIAIMREEVEREGWPINYRTDFEVHDAAAISKFTPKSFIWMVRESGTSLVILDGLDCDSVRRGRKGVQAVHNVWGDGVRYYLFSNGRLSSTTMEKALESIRQTESIDGRTTHQTFY